MKRKREQAARDSTSNGVDTSKPTAVFRPSKGRPYTVSVALPGSIIANAQTHDLKTLLAGQIARALAVFCVDEVVIFDDGTAQATKHQNRDSQRSSHAAHDAETGYTAFSDPGNFLQHVLSYLETPPYLRRALFPHHPNLRTAGSLPSLDMPHHLRADEWCPYREAVTVAVSGSSNHNGSSGTVTTAEVAAGIPNPIQASFPAPSPSLPPNVRVTLHFRPPYADGPPPDPATRLVADAVAPDAPRELGGYYWGYATRLAGSLSAVFEEAPWDDGYDYSIGTSERGESLLAWEERSAARKRASESEGDGEADTVPKWRHLLVVFGGVAGLEAALANDAALKQNGVDDVSSVFDGWVNLVEGQGSRTVRTEEAVWIGLMGLKGLVERNDRRWGMV